MIPSPKTAPPISVIVTTLNEVDRIEGCLRSVEWADEILLVDSFSTDGTVDFVREHFPKVRIEQRDFLGSSAQKNWGIDRVSHDWVLVIDADERVTAPLQNEVRKTVTQDPRFYAYSMLRENSMLGRPLRYGGMQRDWVTRLFHRDHARYQNRRVHAEMDVNGLTGRLRGRFTHQYVRSLDHMVEKMTRYGEWGATQHFLNGRRAHGWEMFVHPVHRFLRDYVIWGGFLDGVGGLLVTVMHAYSTFWKYAKLWEFTRLERLGKKVTLAPVDDHPERWIKPWERGREREERQIRAQHAEAQGPAPRPSP